MDTSRLEYRLPPELIAQRPADRRPDSRLMHLPASGGPRHLRFRDFPGLLQKSDLLVLNDTRVIPARIHARRATGGAVRILFVRDLGGGRAEALVSPGGRIAAGETLRVLGSGLPVAAETKLEGGKWILAAAGGGWTEILSSGRPPLPPYIKRPFEEDPDLAADRERYQTVYAARDGSVAAPTAGLHFDRETLERAKAACSGIATVTLHVGPGTFRPVESPDLDGHVMEAEDCEISAEAASRLNAAIAEGKRIVAVGTTTARCLESAAAAGGIRAGAFRAGVFIRPPYEFRAVSALLTNFHLPGSTLIALAAAFAGLDRLLDAYRTAVQEGYRFYSYGDAMFAEGRGSAARGFAE